MNIYGRDLNIALGNKVEPLTPRLLPPPSPPRHTVNVQTKNMSNDLPVPGFQAQAQAPAPAPAPASVSRNFRLQQLRILARRGGVCYPYKIGTLPPPPPPADVSLVMMFKDLRVPVGPSTALDRNRASNSARTTGPQASSTHPAVALGAPTTYDNQHPGPRLPDVRRTRAGLTAYSPAHATQDAIMRSNKAQTGVDQAHNMFLYALNQYPPRTVCYRSTGTQTADLHSPVGQPISVVPPAPTRYSASHATKPSLEPQNRYNARVTDVEEEDSMNGA